MKTKIRNSLNARINDFFKLNLDKVGSKKRLISLIDNFNEQKPNFMIAGSWAIEIISGEKIKHDDIDIITLDVIPPTYLDDAKYIEEKCNFNLPIEKSYFEDHFISCIFENRSVLVPSLNLQICLKLFGQLQKKLPKRAINQLKIILKQYKDLNEITSKKEFEYIFGKLLPLELNHIVISKNLLLTLKRYFAGEKEEALKELIQLHSLINKSLRYQFEKRGLTKKIKISNK